MESTYIFLQHYWWFIISLLGALLVFLLFVQGGNSLLFHLGKNETERALLVNATGSKWEFTFTTLVTFGGAFFASFPLFYSTSFGGAYWLWMLILFSFVLQAISYEFQSKLGNLLGKRTYQSFLVFNGVMGPVLLGAAVATFFNGSDFLDGSKALSATEKIARGKMAIAALSDFRQAQKDGDQDKMDASRRTLEENMPYLGYGYIQNPDDLVPNVGLSFWTFRIMVGFGMYFIAFFALVLFLSWKNKLYGQRWLHRIALWSIPFAFVASQAGWVVAEAGRQPWAIQDLLPVNAAISNLSAGAVQTTFFIFLAIFTILFIAEIGIMVKAIQKGPESLNETDKKD